MESIELRLVLDELAKQIEDYKEEVKKLEFSRQNERKNTIRDIEDKYYEHWKEMNAKYMKRYIEELIMQDKLTFKFESDYKGYFTMEVHMDDKYLNEFSGCINMNSNAWEE